MPPESEAGGAAPVVTVVLPVRNESAGIERVLGDLQQQDLPRDEVEIVVVDGQSTDDTAERVRRVAAGDARVRLLANPLRRSSAARAIGAAAARGRYVVFVDGHCRLPDPGFLAAHVDLFARTGAWCLARPQPLVASSGAWRARAIAAARSSPFGHSLRSTVFAPREGPVDPTSSGAAYRREVFQEVGTFDPAFDAAEDVEFNWRVARRGLLAWESARLAVAYEARTTWAGLLRQMGRYGYGRARLHQKHPEAFTVESLVPVLFVLALPLLPLSPWLPGAVGGTVVALYALYALLALLAAGAAARRHGLLLLPGIALAFPLIHLGLGAGYVAGRLARLPRGAPAA